LKALYSVANSLDPAERASDITTYIIMPQPPPTVPDLRATDGESCVAVAQDITARKAAETRFRLLVEAGATLSGSSDYETTVRDMLRLATSGGFANFAFFDLLSDDGVSFERIAWAHGDPEREEELAKVRRFPPNMAVNGNLAVRAVETGRPAFAPVVDEEFRLRGTRDPEHRALMRALDARSIISVPLPARGRVLGALTFHRTGEAERPFDREDLALAEELGRRAATAIDNTRLFDAAQRDAEERRRAENALREQDTHLHDILESISDSFYALDAERRITYANKRAAAFWGRRVEQVVGRLFLEAFPEVVGTAPWALVEEVAATRQPIQREIASAISGRWLAASIYPNPSGGTTVFFRDITERRRADEKLRASHQRTAEILESISDAFYAVDHEWRFTYVNRKAEEWWERRREDLIGKVLWDEFSQATGTETQNAHITAAKERRVVRLEVVSPILHHWVDVSIYPSEEGLSVYSRDISERKHAEEALRESEERLRYALQAGRLGFWEFDIATHAFATSETCKANFGRRAEDAFTYQDFIATIHPDDRERQRDAVAAAIAGRGDLDVEYRILWPDGSLHWVQVRGRTTDAGCRPRARMVGVSLDITQRKEAEEALRRLNASLETQIAERTADRDRMWRLSTDVMLVARFDATITAMNPAWTRLFGWREDELLGHSFMDLVHPDDRASTLAEMGRLAQGLTTLRFEHRCRCADGGYRWLSWTAVPNEGLIHAVGRDVTSEKAAAAELQAAQAQLAQAQKMEAVGQLTGGVAHDFNNLLTAVLGNLELLAARLAGDDAAERMLRAAMRAAERGGKLTEQLLAFSRRQHLRPQSVNANRIIAGMSDLLERTMGGTVQVRTHLSADLWPMLVDPTQIEIAILNLAINARDAMPLGGTITIETANVAAASRELPAEVAGRDCVRIAVADVGCGMTEEVLAKAFEPFFTTKEFGKGSGLGLSQVYGGMRQSGGAVRLKSRVGQGTTVLLYLPREAAQHAAAAAAGPETRPSSVADASGRILVVDDEPDVRDITVRMLREAGYGVTEADSGRAALDALARGETYDLIVIDIAMPDLNGIDTVRHIRERWPGQRALFMTGYADTTEFAEQTGGDPLIRKPFKLNDLADAVQQVLGRTRGPTPGSVVPLRSRTDKA